MINRKIFSLFISFESVTLHQKSIQIIQKQSTKFSYVLKKKNEREINKIKSTFKGTVQRDF